MISPRQPVPTITRQPTIIARPNLSIGSTRAMLQQCRAAPAGAKSRRDAAMWWSWSGGSERSIWACGHAARSIRSRVGRQRRCVDRPALQITLLRLREALISCLEQQRDEELRIGRAWDKCAPEAFDWVAAAARQPAAKSRRSSRRSEARRRMPFHVAQQVTMSHALKLRGARRTARRWSAAAATWRQI